ncbi:MAG TPA: hypothetical protein VHT70_02310 [Candidatus Saccharimonadales bacterium]|jgi:hypothetical protein|nr:hypothetical protein [Candidatus Saccharimonadales bacterium]
MTDIPHADWPRPEDFFTPSPRETFIERYTCVPRMGRDIALERATQFEALGLIQDATQAFDDALEWDTVMGLRERAADRDFDEQIVSAEYAAFYDDDVAEAVLPVDQLLLDRFTTAHDQPQPPCWLAHLALNDLCGVPTA